MEKIFTRIDGYRDEIITLQRELTARVALGPQNGGSGEHEKIDFIKGLLEEMTPSDIDIIKAPDENAQDDYRPNLIAFWKGATGGETVWVLSHADIVPPGNLDLWDGDPYEIIVDGDRIVGRGVEDNQHGFVSPYLALRAILDAGIELKRSVGLIVVADEETGSDYGLNYLLENHGDYFKNSDLIVVPDAGNEEGTMVEVAEKSMLWLKFSVKGHQCHASTPEKGNNSLLGAAKLIVALQELKEAFPSSDSIFSPPTSTFEATKIEGNVPNVNTISGTDTFYLDCRVLPQYELNEVILASKEIAGRIARENKLEINVEIAHRQDAALPTSPDAPVVKALENAIREVTGKKAVPMGIGGGTVAAFFRKKGLPAAVWHTCQDTAHQPNEYCLISDIIKDAKIFTSLYMGG
jgi:succinyl-diaminopimelate desuccinylase